MRVAAGERAARTVGLPSWDGMPVTAVTNSKQGLMPVTGPALHPPPTHPPPRPRRPRRRRDIPGASSPPWAVSSSCPPPPVSLYSFLGLLNASFLITSAASNRFQFSYPNL